MNDSVKRVKQMQKGGRGSLEARAMAGGVRWMAGNEGLIVRGKTQ